MIEMMSDDYHLDQAFYINILQKITNELNINGNIVIKVGDKDESQQLNRDYLRRDYPTDVLSFTLNEELPDGFYLGDIFVCYPLAEEQAGENHISLEEELLTLMIHGLLHLAGYDHETENDKGQMLALQNRLVKKVLP
jgi:probable rRNA maturation factor